MFPSVPTGSGIGEEELGTEECCLYSMFPSVPTGSGIGEEELGTEECCLYPMFPSVPMALVEERKSWAQKSAASIHVPICANWL